MEMNKTVDDPQGSTKTISESPERQTLPQEILSTGTQLVPPGAQLVPTEAHSKPTEAQFLSTEAQHVSTEAHIIPTEAQLVPTEEAHQAPIGEGRLVPTEAQHRTGDLEIPGPSFTSTIRRESLMNKCSMITMMLDHDNDDSDDDEENNKELDQAALSRLCAVSGEMILRENARALSELTIRTVLAEERITLEARRMSKMAIQSAYSVAVVTPRRSSKKPNIFRRLLACCFGCCRRRN